MYKKETNSLVESDKNISNNKLNLWEEIKMEYRMFCESIFFPYFLILICLIINIILFIFLKWSN